MDVDYIYCSNYFMMYMSDHYAVCLYTLFSVNYISIKLKEKHTDQYLVYVMRFNYL